MTNCAQAVPELNYFVSRRSRYEHSKTLGLSPWDLLKYQKTGFIKKFRQMEMTPRAKVIEEWLDRYLILSVLDTQLSEAMLADLSLEVSDDLGSLCRKKLESYKVMGALLASSEMTKHYSLDDGWIQQSQSYYDKDLDLSVKLYSDYLSYDGSRSFQIHVVSDSQLRRVRRGIIAFKRKLHNSLMNSLSHRLTGKPHQVRHIFISESSFFTLF